MTSQSEVLHDELRTTSRQMVTSDTPSNVASHFRHVKGDIEKGFAEADVIIEREFNTRPGASNLS